MDGCGCTEANVSVQSAMCNYTFHFHVDDYLNVIRDAGNPQEARGSNGRSIGFTNLHNVHTFLKK